MHKTWFGITGVAALPVSVAQLSFHGRIYNLNFLLWFFILCSASLSDFSGIPQGPLWCGEEESKQVASQLVYILGIWKFL